jgi:predicted secreted protein
MEVPTTIALKVGEVYLLKLDSLGTAGYIWTCTMTGDADLLVVTAERAEAPRQSSEPVIHGASAAEQFRLLAQQPGQVALLLTQQRPWETTQPPLKQYSVAVKIQPGEA